MKKFLQFINNTFDVKINWLTRKMRTLVQLKDKSLHPSCKIYEGICSCSESYVGETIRNIETRQSEHNVSHDKSNPPKHLNENTIHIFRWRIIGNAPKRKLACKILEVYFIATMKPTLNN